MRLICLCLHRVDRDAANEINKTIAKDAKILENLTATKLNRLYVVYEMPNI